VGSTGWTWEQVEQQLDLHRLAALKRQWRRHPPVHHLVAAFLGHKPDDGPGAPSAQAASADLDQLAASAVVIKSAPKLDTSAWDARPQSQG
jgi:hypothetical protein